MLPIIAGTDYADLLRTVGHARVELGGRHGRPSHGDRHRRRRRDPPPGHALAARDAAGRVAEGRLAGRLGDGGHGRHRHAGVARGDQEGSDDGRVGPIAARPGRAARLRGHRGAQPDGGGGVPGGRARRRRSGGARSDPVGRGGRERDVPFVAVRAGCGGRRRRRKRRRPLLRVLQERARAVAQRIGAAPPHRRLPRRPAAAHAVGGRRGRTAVDPRPGHARARAALVAAGVHGRQRAVDGQRALVDGRRGGGAAWRARRVAVGRARARARHAGRDSGHARGLRRTRSPRTACTTRCAASAARRQARRSPICSPARNRRSSASGV